MASDKNFVDYVTQQLGQAGVIRAKKMFGDYGLYCDEVFFALVCDNQCFIKATAQGEAAFPHLPKAPPYEGAKEALLVEDLEDREALAALARLTCQALAGQPAKPTKKKGLAPFDYKKEYKAFYLPPKKPGLVTLPPMNFLAVQGQGDPNQAGGAYQEAIGLLYAVAFTIKMSKKSGQHLEGYFDYVVPPLEGLWWQEGGGSVDFSHKESFHWTALLRLPDFVTRETFAWAVTEAGRKKKLDLSPVEFFSYEEGLCVQCLHIGPYDSEPETLRAMTAYAAAQGYTPDPSRRHHEIYLSDPRRCKPENLKTVLRQPVKKQG